jgi:hypothetical protein
MDRRTIVLIVVVFILIIIGMFTFTGLMKKEVEVKTVPDVVVETVVPYPNITRIDAKHYFSDGLHTFVGEIEMPTPCDLIEVNSIVKESFPEQIQLEFKVINNAEVCAQVITPQRFLVEAKASEGATASAMFMGRSVELNLIPALPGESPADFELFIKG